MEPRMRTIQPPHRSDKFTLAQAQKAWRKVEREMQAEREAKKAQGRRPAAVVRPPSRAEGHIAADRERPPRRRSTGRADGA